jgi:hypothetical protein
MGGIVLPDQTMLCLRIAILLAMITFNSRSGQQSSLFGRVLMASEE